MTRTKYAVVIPAKNEEQNLAATLDSVVKQTVQPEACLIVDDGSVDNTLQIANDFAKSNPNFRCVQRANIGSYVLGGHVVSVFLYGKEYLDSSNLAYDFIVKLDADLAFEPDFVERIVSRIDTEQWAVVSGTPYQLESGKKIFDYSPEWHSHGQFKFYNRLFLEQIESIPRSLGWDCADNIVAMDMGWKTAAFRDIHYQMFRPVGGKSSLTTGRTKHGIGAYVLGYSPVYFLLRVIHDLLKPPYIIGSCAMLAGYLKAMISRSPKILNEQQQALLRHCLWRSFGDRIQNKDFQMFQRISKS